MVVDVSVAGKWFLDDEKSPAADAVLTRIENGETAHAPAIFQFEITNLLLAAERTSRISPDDVEEALERLRDLGIQLHGVGSRYAPGADLVYARKHGLTAYDAAYLTCALDLGCSLATGDARLEKAARAESIETTFV